MTTFVSARVRNQVGVEDSAKGKRSAMTFRTVTRVALTFPHVVLQTKYDGSPVLKAGGCFLAAVATHASAEPQSLIIRNEFEDREFLLADAPDTYYVTEYYRKYPVVLARLSHLHPDALRDLLATSWRLTMAKTRTRGTRGPRSHAAQRGSRTPRRPGRRRSGR